MGKIGKDTWSELKLIKGRAVINGGWRWGWLFSGGCGPLLKQPPVQALRESMTYLGETEKTDAEVEQWNARFLKEKPLREQISAEYAISVASWLIGANALLKQLENVENDRKEEEEEVNDEFEDCSEDHDGEKDLVETEDANKEEQMSKEGLVAFVKEDGDDDHLDTDDEDPNYSPSTEKSDTEDDLSEEEEEDDQGNESYIREKDLVVKLAEKKRKKERQEDETTDEERG